VPSANFVLETFEDHLFNSPGVTASAGYVTSTHFSGAIIDSVDGDDGVIGNGTCTSCDSYFNNGQIAFVFNAATLGGLPSRAGIVWTDGPSGTGVVFEAFDAFGLSLGRIERAGIGDNSNLGTTAEDRFFGIVYAGGIKEAAHQELVGSDRSRPFAIRAALQRLECVDLLHCQDQQSGMRAAHRIERMPERELRQRLRHHVLAGDREQVGSALLRFQREARRRSRAASCASTADQTLADPELRRQSAARHVHGVYTFDMNAWIQSGVDPLLVPGTACFTQYWSRDPASASTTGLSDGLTFVIGA
jgi:hypothetical protein